VDGGVSLGWGGGQAALSGARYSARCGVVLFPWSRSLGRRGIRLAISAGLASRGRPGIIGGKQERDFLAQNLLFMHLCDSKTTRVFAGVFH
jgi:hypothetical protein